MTLSIVSAVASQQPTNRGFMDAKSLAKSVESAYQSLAEIDQSVVFNFLAEQQNAFLQNGINALTLLVNVFRGLDDADQKLQLIETIHHVAASQVMVERMRRVIANLDVPSNASERANRKTVLAHIEDRSAANESLLGSAHSLITTLFPAGGEIIRQEVEQERQRFFDSFDTYFGSI